MSTARTPQIGLVAESNGMVRPITATVPARPRTYDEMWKLVNTMVGTLDLCERAQRLQREELDFLAAKHEALLADVAVLREQVRLGR